MDVSIRPISLTQGNVISIQIQGFSEFFPDIININIAKVEDDYTEFAMQVDKKPNLSGDTISVAIEATQNLQPGLYQVTRVEMKKNQINPVVLTGKELGLYIFEVRSPTMAEQSYDQLVAWYKSILKARKIDFLKGLGSGSAEFTALVFVRDLLLTSRMRLGQLEVIPFEGLGCNDEIDLVRRFISEFKIGDLSNTDNILQAAKQGQPSIVIHFPVIRADSPEGAGHFAEQEAASIVALLALQRGGAGAIFGSMLIRQSSGELYYRIHTPIYQGNLLGGFISGEDPKIIKRRIENMRKSDRAKLYVEIFREALLEPNMELKWFRFWNILETVARSKAYVGQPKRDWNGVVIHNRKGKPQTIQDKAEDIVFELLRTVLSQRSISESSFAGDLQQGLLSQQIPIWYRRRNCVVHGGECLCQNPSLSVNNLQLLNCKRARDEQPDIRIDQYLSTLQEVTKLILYNELN